MCSEPLTLRDVFEEAYASWRAELTQADAAGVPWADLLGTRLFQEFEDRAARSGFRLDQRRNSEAQIGFDSKAFGQPSRHMKRADVRSASPCHVVKFVVAAETIQSSREVVTLPDVEGGPAVLRPQKGPDMSVAVDENVDPESGF